ncbi:LacI family transcriptional regulator [Acholeplasma sp. OttesenSCG-928-E16]|nr:LacI family transcriptional regulator [Acholeplasma sp. OttesenSCG-928-E16]
MKPTIRDVAKKANVSVSTVSRVINQKGYVHESTKEAVDKAIRDLGFIPNQLARSLTSRSSSIVGVIFPHIGPSFYGELLEGIESQATSYGYKIIFCHTNDDPNRELEYINFFEQYNIDGLIVASNFSNTEALDNLNIPIVTIDHIWDENIPSITSDNVEGGYLAAKHFYETGCKKVLLFRGPSFLLTTIERTMGFMRFADKVDMEVLIYDFDIVNPDFKLIKKTIVNNNGIDGIFAFSDTIAFVTSSALSDLKINVPGEVSLIGYDNSIFSKWNTPALTTINQSIKFLGQQSLISLVKLIKNEPLEQFHEVVGVSLVLRESTKKI